MKSGSKRGRIMVEFMMYILLSVFLMGSAMRLYLGVFSDYLKNIRFLKHTDYAYHTFEVLKVDFYTDRESFALAEDVLHIRKSEYVTGNAIMLLQRDQRLIYLYGTKVQELCHGLEDVIMRQQGDILFIRLVFPDVTYERGFYVGD